VTTEGAGTRHPLDPLSEQEIRHAAEILRRDQGVGDIWRFAIIELREPDKAALASGDGVAREAAVTCWNRADDQTYKAAVSLDEDRVVAWDHRPGEQANFTEDEFHDIDVALRRDPRVVEALRRNGVEDMELVLLDTFPVQAAEDAGLPAWTAADRSIENTDVVLWYVFGIHHVTRPEEWPVMAVDTVSFWAQALRVLRPQPGPGRPRAVTECSPPKVASMIGRARSVADQPESAVDAGGIGEHRGRRQARSWPAERDGT
jgi:Cu2+-containing amine oxidase